MARLAPLLESKLIAFAETLVDQSHARVIVPPQRAAPGFWFGGGNLVADADGTLYLVGRYRNQGDSRTGLAAGERGLELAVFQSRDHGQTFQKLASFSKQALSQPGRDVLSIEGSALHLTQEGIELYVSSEKAGIDYPSGLESFLKPGCGVWTIERLSARSLDELTAAKPDTILQSSDPERLHVKDPHCYLGEGDQLVVMYCTHPFNWSSSNTAFAVRPPGSSQFMPSQHDWFGRGNTWDVAISRGTCLIDVPRVGAFREQQVTLLFYDGGESLRNLDEHVAAVKRPRGYSCEELGGLAYAVNGDLSEFHRLSRTLPLFVSPYGTGCSRYVDVLKTSRGYFVTWQQSQPDLSQPLVLNFVELDTAESTLA